MMQGPVLGPPFFTTVSMPIVRWIPKPADKEGTHSQAHEVKVQEKAKEGEVDAHWQRLCETRCEEQTWHRASH